MPTPKPGLRARKLARAKADLLAALAERLPDRRFEDIPVKELCEVVGISEPTFFSYFPRKTDLLFYFIQLWSLRCAERAKRALDEEGPRAAVWSIFELTGKEMSKGPAVGAEVMAFQARLPTQDHLEPLTLAERQLALPDVLGVERLPAEGLQSLLPSLLEAAISAGELPAHTDVAAATLALAAVFFGVPVAVLPRAPTRILAAYRSQFDLVWNALATERKKERKS